jgi:dolichyl-phosphate-mannose--protein O-mannosyl transferase
MAISVQAVLTALSVAANASFSQSIAFMRYFSESLAIAQPPTVTFHARRSSISRSFCSISAIRLLIRSDVSGSNTAVRASWRYFKILIFEFHPLIF